MIDLEALISAVQQRDSVGFTYMNTYCAHNMMLIHNWLRDTMHVNSPTYACHTHTSLSCYPLCLTTGHRSGPRAAPHAHCLSILYAAQSRPLPRPRPATAVCVSESASVSQVFPCLTSQIPHVSGTT